MPDVTIAEYERRANHLFFTESLELLREFVHKDETPHALVNGARAGEPPAEISHCYRVVKRILYEGDPDDKDEIVGCDTLEECEQEVCDFIYRDSVEDYEYDARVFDLNTGKEIRYRTVQAITWLLDGPSEPEEGDHGEEKPAARRR